MAALAVLLLAAQLVTAASVPVKPAPPAGVLDPTASTATFTSLRGSNASAPAAAPSAAAPVFVDERGERGHFYYSEACEDCFYKEPQCGCRPAMEYFACLTKHCHASNHSRFTEKCTHLGDKCSSSLSIDCNGPQTVCASKHNELPAGGVGLTMDFEGIGDDAFCGPHGTCIGTVHMKADIHHGQALLPAPMPVSGPAPAPAIVSGPAPAPGLSLATAAPVWLECGLPNVSNADIGNQTHWITCRAQVVGDRAECDLPMFSSLQAAAGKKAYCVLTEGSEGKKLTEPDWFLVSNIHEKQTSSGAWGTGAWPWMKSGTEPRSMTWGVLALLGFAFQWM